MDNRDEARQPRTGTVVFGLGLIGLGGTAALAAQTGLSIIQAGSIMLFTCAAILFSFLVDRTRNRTGVPGPPRD